MAPAKTELLQRAGLLLLRTRSARLAETPLRKALEGKRGRSRVTLVVPMPDDSEAEVTLPGSYSIAAGLRDTIGGLPGIAQVEEI